MTYLETALKCGQIITSKEALQSLIDFAESINVAEEETRRLLELLKPDKPLELNPKYFNNN